MARRFSHHYSVAEARSLLPRLRTWIVELRRLRLDLARRDEQLAALLAEHRPTTAAVEQLFFGRNITTAIAVGQARGVLLLALAEAGVGMGEYSPPKVKEAVTGYGKAEKAQVQLMVRHMLDLAETPQPDDAADALAVAIAHAQYEAFRVALEQ